MPIAIDNDIVLRRVYASTLSAAKTVAGIVSPSSDGVIDDVQRVDLRRRLGRVGTAVEETTVEETPVEETPVEETPVGETPVGETPVESGVVEDIWGNFSVWMGEEFQME